MQLIMPNPSKTGPNALRKVGRKLAVYGVINGGPESAQGWWHIMNPGRFSVPLLSNGVTSTSVGKSLCGRDVQTNGYAQDYAPPNVCPACAERL